METNERNEIRDVGMPLSAIAIRQQVNLIQEIMREVMQKDQHYGVIPGCIKPSLLKPGAEKLCLTFRLRPVMGDGDITITDMGEGHREYSIRCHILNSGGLEMATGVGSATTKETKFRYRNIADYEVTGEDIPKDAKEKKAEYRKKGFGCKLVNGAWAWVKYKDAQKAENPDIADVYNTVLKMAKKRAFVDGILSATAASDIFTQDIEDMPVTPQSNQDDLQALAERKKAEFHAEDPKTPPAKPQATPVSDKSAEPEVKTATGQIIFHNLPKGASKYHSFCLHGYKGVYFQTADPIMIETLDGMVEAGEDATLEYSETSWEKNGKTGLNRHITGLIVHKAAEVTE